LVGSGCADFWEVADWSSAERGRRLLSAEASLSKALASAPDNALAHLLLSAVKTYSNRPAQGIAGAERALALDANLAPAWTTIGLAKHFIGHPEETEHYVRQALRLSPRDRLTFIWFGIVGASKLHVGRYEDATTWLMQSVAINPNFASTRFLLAAAFAQMDRIPEARAEAGAALALNPRFTIGGFRANPDCDSADFLKQRHNVYEGLRKAQVPET
jgi:tetratricopeptide (TPR) repeat protein